MSAQMAGAESVDYSLVWNMGHGSDEGTTTGTFVEWVHAICAETAAGPAGGDTSEDAYKAYLKEYVDAVPAVADDHLSEFFALIDAGDYTTMPADMMFNAEWWGYAAMTYDEFVAAGGVYEIPAFDPNLTAD